MATRKEYELALKIVGQMESSFGSTINLTKKQIRSIATEAAKANATQVTLSKTLTSMTPGIDAAWKGLTTTVKTTAAAMAAAGAAGGAVGAWAISAGSDFESAFAGVRKTVNGTEEQLAELEQGIRDMAKNKPQTAAELSEIAESAGQLGIATENIVDFTSTIADLKEATNLGDEGASQFAQFANITGMDQSQFSNLGSTVVALGNNLATTEADIMSMSMRLAGAGTQVGLTEAEILGLSGALSSVGIEAEAGGSAMSKLMINMQLAVETGSESLAGYAEVANMTGQEFQKAFKEDAAGALTAFISGLNDTERLGKSTIAVVNDLGITEVRLRDTILRAAGASDLFESSLKLASTSFAENTALANEANQRYATFESRLQMVKNRVNDVGVSLYQDFRDPLSDCLDIALDFTDELELFDQDYISDLATDFKANIPTAVRYLKEGKEAVEEFAEPLLSLGSWMLEHKDVIGGGLAGIATAITAAKVATTINTTAQAMNALRIAMMANPLTLGIGAAVAAVGVIAGVATKVKVANAELKKANLAAHFGNITLSMSELEETAKYIVGEGDLNQLSAAMEELGKVSDIADSLDSASGSLSRLTWKVGLGMELSETDQDEFASSVQTMINDSLSLVEQAQYATHVNVAALFGDGDTAGQELLAGFDSMYQGINAQVTELGNQLGETYNNAMQDGIIDTDEAALIQELQAQLASVTEQVSQAQFDAKMERIRLEYSGKDLDAESFQNLQAEIQETLDEALTSSQAAYEYSLANLNVQLERSQSGEISPEDAEYLSQELYDEAKQALDEKLADKEMELSLKGITFTSDTIADAYGDEIQNILEGMDTGLNEAMQNAIQTMQFGGNGAVSWDVSTVQKLLNVDELDGATRSALAELWEGIEPDYEALQSAISRWTEAGNEIPESLAESLASASAIGAIAGSQDAIWGALALTAAENPQYAEALQSAQEAGYELPESIAAGIAGNQAAVNTAIDRSRAETETYLSTHFNRFQVNPILDVSFTVKSSGSYQIPQVTQHASGGIFDTPHFGVFAESGPEAFIPIDNTNRSRSIWQETGELLGMTGGSGSSGDVTNASSESRIVYSPTYQISGADEETVRRATADDYSRFEQFMAQYSRRQARLAF